MRSCQILFLFFIIRFNIFAIGIHSQPDSILECTIGVASGKATSDGRPLLWKTRDMTIEPNILYYNTSYKYKFIGVTTAKNTSFTWMGMNEHGFSIVASRIYDLKVTNTSGVASGQIMSITLGTCRTVEEFQQYLDKTNLSGRSDMANFAVIDSTGAAKLFEAGGDNYYSYDTEEANEGYIVRTNFSIKGEGTAGLNRYIRSNKLINDFYNGDSLNYKSILRYQLRDLSNPNSTPIPVPNIAGNPEEPTYGYINWSNSICNNYSIAAAVIHGVSKKEHPGLSTMWTMLGSPSTSIAVPYWPIGEIPYEASSSNKYPLYAVSDSLKQLLYYNNPKDVSKINSFKLKNPCVSKDNYVGLWYGIFSMEDEIMYRTNIFLDSIRQLDQLPIQTMLHKEETLTKQVYKTLQQEYGKMRNATHVTPCPRSADEKIQIYPTFAHTNITVKINNSNKYVFKLYNMTGQTVKEQQIENNPEIMDVSMLCKGIYLAVFTGGDEIITKKIILE